MQYKLLKKVSLNKFFLELTLALDKCLINQIKNQISAWEITKVLLIQNHEQHQ